MVVLSHGFPVDKGSPELIPAGLVSLSDRLSSDSGWRVIACCLRGVGGSEGSFSLGGWLEDLGAVVKAATGDTPPENTSGGGAWLVGTGITGALAICLAAQDPRVRGVASLAAPATFSDWAANPAAVATYARDVGVLKSAKGPRSGCMDPRLRRDPSGGRGEASEGSTGARAARADDDVVPADDARAIANEIGDSAELRILARGGTPAQFRSPEPSHCCSDGSSGTGPDSAQRAYLIEPPGRQHLGVVWRRAWGRLLR